jgi:tetratricopeptide (TPR) repeat protein
MTEPTFIPIHQPKPDPDPIILRKFDVELQNLNLLHGDKHISIAILYTSIGEYYYSLELYGDAKIQFELSLSIFEELLDSSSEYVIDANYRLSKVLTLLPSDAHEEGSAFEKAQISKSRQLREQYDSTINSSSLEEDSILSSESTNYNIASYELRQDNNKSNSIDSTLVYNDLAEEARISGNYEEASRLYEKSIVLRKRKYGEDSPAVAPVLINLGDMLRIQGQYEAAQGYLEQALGINMQGKNIKFLFILII